MAEICEKTEIKLRVEGDIQQGSDVAEKAEKSRKTTKVMIVQY